MIKVIRVKQQTLSIQFSHLLSYHLGHGLGGCTVGTTTGIPAEIVEVVVPQTSSPNPTKMPTIVYGRLLHLPLKGFYFSQTQMEGTGATVGAKYPSARRRRFWLANMKMIGYLQQQMIGEPHAPYHIKPPLRSRLGEGDNLNRKLITIL
jgi:hypothetical protein